MSHPARHSDESRRWEDNRPTLPPIRDLFGRELARPPHPDQGLQQSPYSHPTTQLPLTDEPTMHPVHSNAHIPPQTNRGPAYHPHNSPQSSYMANPSSPQLHSHREYSGHAPPRSFTSPYPAATPPVVPAGHNRSSSTPDPRYPSQYPPRSNTHPEPWSSPTFTRPTGYSSQYQATAIPPQQAGYPSGPMSGPSSYGPPSLVPSRSPYEMPYPTVPEPVPSSSAKYECNYCGKGFTRPSSLKIHLHSHTGERPYVCTVEGCGRTFSVQSNMRRHARTHGLPREDSGDEEASEGSPSMSGRRPSP
ncbi:uncharacterized protein STEHIDRAFT_126619 [Stereum hirsutum FP-91666 SS1]|uniref:C2H2-type domain-containing protein n=1 Tax=Stereum hirsutum (strain FP-91666) TaxID=721885 RepID=R7RWM2_STEHR|nr:uncharacterized protein STEHIDRAFT_126619 [Stereum hirsutum FP-91666 SS1]EIM79173.1 hypothetical protein STEHIDRAFT_126619 [Stereum hirsutum FP-91666 SS1]